MLELKNVKKTYKVGEIETRALNGISVAFRDREFVAILGASGSGKTTCLNIIGGLDRYDSGEMTIKGKQTASFKDGEWDAYRNNSIGFVFQSYNLITHLSIVANVELGMTLSGVSKSEKRKRAVDVLTKVGLKDHLHKRPNQLSGGQMQRVAIARALANNPEILLCDEPTGALDSATSRQIMDLIRELSKERLVIMVTHNAEMAEGYADRTIKFEDGVVVSDSNPHIERPKPDMFNLKKTAMSFLTALNLSGNNILTKKGRTFLTAFASSIGIIGIAVILSLSNGFQLQIDKFQEDAMAEFPILLSREVMDFDYEQMQQSRSERREKESVAPTEITVFDPGKFYTQHTSNFSSEYIKYIEDIDPEIATYVGYQRMLNVNVLRKDDDEVAPIIFPTLVTMMTGGGMEIGGGDMSSMMSSSMGLSSFPLNLDKDSEEYMEKNYELLEGEFPSEPTDLLLIIGENGRLNKSTLNQIGFETERDTISFDEILNTEFKLISNNDFYTEIEDLSSLAADMGLRPTGLPEDFDLAAIPDNTSVGDAVAGIISDYPDRADLIAVLSAIPTEYLTGVITHTENGTMIVDPDTTIPLIILIQDNGVIAVIDPMSQEVLITYPEIPAEIMQSQKLPEEGIESGTEIEPLKYFIPNSDYQAMWDSENSTDLRITGIVRAKEESGITLLLNGIVYSDDLLEMIIRDGSESDIVKVQQEREESVFPMSGQESIIFAKELLLSTLGANGALGAVTVYPTSFANKDALLEYLDAWNDGKVCTCELCKDCKGKSEKEELCEECKALAPCEMVIYTDLAGELLGFMSEITHAITIVLIAFASISLVVSLIMIAIITYISVLERTKEIGILRALGARKKDITRVFDAETFLIGAFSGIIGVFIAWLLTFPANVIIENMTNLPGVAQLSIVHVVLLLIISTTLTVLGGHLPARMASKRDAVEALRSE